MTQPGFATSVVLLHVSWGTGLRSTGWIVFFTSNSKESVLQYNIFWLCKASIRAAKLQRFFYLAHDFKTVCKLTGIRSVCKLRGARAATEMLVIVFGHPLHQCRYPEICTRRWYFHYQSLERFLHLIRGLCTPHIHSRNQQKSFLPGIEVNIISPRQSVSPSFGSLFK